MPRVIDETGLSEQPTLKYELVAFDYTPVETLELPYNPETYKIDGTSEWQRRGAAGAKDDASDWSGNSPDTLSFSYTFAVSMGWTPEGIQRAVEQLKRWRKSPTLRTQEPSRILVRLGPREFEGVINSIGTEVVRTNPRGLPLLLVATINMTENLKSQAITFQG